MAIYYDATDLIGNTPVLLLRRLTGEGDAELYAKLEWYNIGGSIKDRTALNLIEHAEAAGVLKKGKRIIEATSGNTGIALAMLGAIRGYDVTIVMSEAVSEERRKIISAYGAELILTPSSLGTAGAIEMKERLLQKYPDRYVAVDQFSDPANILAHYQRTATEIIKDFGHSLDAVVATIGTGGTTSGLALRLKQFDRRIRVIGVTPALGVRIQGIRNPREPRPSKLVHTDWLDEVVEITEEQKKECFRVASLAASREGILIGMSSSCALYVAMKEASRLGSGHRVLAILPDSGYKYLSTELYQDRSRRASPDEA